MPLWAFATTRSARWPTMLGMLAVSAACGAAALVAFSRTVAPYSSGVFSLLAMSTSPGLAAIADSVSSNLARLSKSDQFVFIEILHRYQYVACVLVASAATVISALEGAVGAADGTRRTLPRCGCRHGGRGRGDAPVVRVHELRRASRAVGVSPLRAAALCGGAWQDWPTPGCLPDTLESGQRQRVAEDLRGLPPRSLHRRYGCAATESGHRRQGRVSVRSVSLVQHAADVAIPDRSDGISPGIGLSVLQNPDRIVPRPRSRYLLLDESALAAFRSPLNVDPIVALPYGTLYVNRDADCDGQR
jgi:hypothetical protein